MLTLEKIVHYIEFPKKWTTADCFIWATTQDYTPTQIRNYPHLEGEGKIMLFREATLEMPDGTVRKLSHDEVKHLESTVYPDGKEGPKVVFFGGETQDTEFVEQPINEHLKKVQQDRDAKLKGVYEKRANEVDAKAKHDSLGKQE